jgi:hypothetical protein
VTSARTCVGSNGVRVKRGDPEQEVSVWAEKIAEGVRLRAAYQHQQAAGLMTLEELASKLGELDEMRRHAERELAALKNYEERIAEMEADRDALFEYMEAKIPEEPDNLTGEERNRVYRMLRVEVKPTLEGYEITGVFLPKGSDALLSMQHRKTSELTFRALLTRGASEVQPALG